MTDSHPKLNDTAEFHSPPTLKGVGIVASLTVKELTKSLNWYVELLGFEVVQRMEEEGKLRAAVIVGGNARLVINQDDGGRGWDRVKGEGFALTILTDEPVDDVAKRFVAAGGKLDTEPTDMPWGARIFKVIDPDGYRFSVSSV